jgi:DNA polymerase I-like protein with 3'-5' exonuclease and polymerase domains
MRGIDVETTALSPEEGQLRLVQLSTGKGARVYDMYHDEPDEVRQAIAGSDELVAHNAVFERKWLKHVLGVDIGVIHDTMIMSQVLYTGTRAAMKRTFSHSLKSCVNRELKIEMDKEEQQSDWNALVLTPEQKRYAAFDAAVLPKLADRLLRRIDQAGLRATYDLELRVSHAVADMQDHGVTIHTDKLDEMIEDATEQATRLKAELTEEWGINPGSGKQLREYFDLDEREGWPKTAGSAPNLQNIPKRGDREKQMRGLFWSGSDDRCSLKADYASIELWLAAVRCATPTCKTRLGRASTCTWRRPRRCSTSQAGGGH